MIVEICGLRQTGRCAEQADLMVRITGISLGRCEVTNIF